MHRPPLARPLAACALVSLVVLAAGCMGSRIARPYPPPTTDAIVAHLQSVEKRAPTLKAETKTDVRLGRERANVTVYILAERGGKMRYQAMDPSGALAADLATDGDDYCFIDVRANCAECGPATPGRVARLIRIPLLPGEVVDVLLGGTPVLPGAKGTVTWDESKGREIVELTGHGFTQRIELDGRKRRWDVVSSERRDSAGKRLWRLQHKDFHDVKTAAGETVRLPGASLFEEGGDTVRILWRDQSVGEKIDATKFRLTPQEGLKRCDEPARAG